MKNKHVLFIFIMLLTFIVTPVYAETYLESTGSDVAIRTGPSTTGTTVLKRADKGDRFDLVTTELVKTQGGCESGYWYKIKYNGQEAYFCSAYAKVVTTEPIVITAEAAVIPTAPRIAPKTASIILRIITIKYIFHTLFALSVNSGLSPAHPYRTLYVTRRVRIVATISPICSVGTSPSIVA